MKLPRWLWLSLIGLIATAWATSFVLSTFNKGYQPPESVNFLFTTVIGGLILAGGRSGNGGNGGSNDTGSEP